MIFRVGQKVACIKAASLAPYIGTHDTVKGRVYTVRDVYACPAAGKPALRFDEHINPIHPTYGVECGYFAERFRPLVERKTDISFAHEILRKASKRVRA